MTHFLCPLSLSVNNHHHLRASFRAPIIGPALLRHHWGGLVLVCVCVCVCVVDPLRDKHTQVSQASCILWQFWFQNSLPAGDRDGIEMVRKLDCLLLQFPSQLQPQILKLYWNWPCLCQSDFVPYFCTHTHTHTHIYFLFCGFGFVNQRTFFTLEKEKSSTSQYGSIH